MINDVVYDVLDTFAGRYIPEGRHKLLHVNSREAWVDLMVDLLEKELIPVKATTIKNCAVHWEILLTHRLSLLN